MAFNGRNSPTLRRHRQQELVGKLGRKPQPPGQDMESEKNKSREAGPSKEHRMRTLLSRLSLMVVGALYLPGRAFQARWRALAKMDTAQSAIKQACQVGQVSWPACLSWPAGAHLRKEIEFKSDDLVTDDYARARPAVHLALVLAPLLTQADCLYRLRRG